MQADVSLAALISKAAELAGSEAKLARALGIPQSHVTNWKAGTRTCTPEDRARLAGFAREDALQELVRATLEKTAGTLRGEQLRQLLGKSLPQIIVGIALGLLVGVSMISGNFDLGTPAVLFLVLCIFHNVYYVN